MVFIHVYILIITSHEARCNVAFRKISRNVVRKLSRAMGDFDWRKTNTPPSYHRYKPKAMAHRCRVSDQVSNFVPLVSIACSPVHEGHGEFEAAH